MHRRSIEWGLVCRGSSWFSARLVVMTDVRNNFCVFRSSSHGWQNNQFGESVSCFFPSDSIRDESEARAHSTWKNFRGEMRTFAEVRRNSSAVYLSTPHQLLTQGSIRAFRRSNQDSLLMQQDIYAWTVRTYWRAETSNRKTRLICL